MVLTITPVNPTNLGLFNIIVRVTVSATPSAFNTDPAFVNSATLDAFTFNLNVVEGCTLEAFVPSALSADIIYLIDGLSTL